jgi:hypothetical protein
MRKEEDHEQQGEGNAMTMSATRETLRLPDRAPPVAGRPAGGPELRLTAKAIKTTLVLAPEELLTAARSLPEGQRVPVRIDAAGRRLTASLNAKSVRKVLATIKESGPDGVAVILQGKLVGDAIEEAGLVAQPRVKPAVVEGGRNAA